MNRWIVPGCRVIRLELAAMCIRRCQLSFSRVFRRFRTLVARVRRFRAVRMLLFLSLPDSWRLMRGCGLGAYAVCRYLFTMGIWNLRNWEIATQSLLGALGGVPGYLFEVKFFSALAVRDCLSGQLEYRTGEKTSLDLFLPKAGVALELMCVAGPPGRTAPGTRRHRLTPRYVVRRVRHKMRLKSLAAIPMPVVLVVDVSRASCCRLSLADVTAGLRHTLKAWEFKRKQGAVVSPGVGIVLVDMAAPDEEFLVWCGFSNQGVEAKWWRVAPAVFRLNSMQLAFET